MNSLQGHLLVASPHLPDPNFYRSVVLIIEHNEESATGLVLNRPGPHTIQEIWPEFSEGLCASTKAIRIGGPLSGPLLAVPRRVVLRGRDGYARNLCLKPS